MSPRKGVQKQGGGSKGSSPFNGRSPSGRSLTKARRKSGSTAARKLDMRGGARADDGQAGGTGNAETLSTLAEMTSRHVRDSRQDILEAMDIVEYSISPLVGTDASGDIGVVQALLRTAAITLSTLHQVCTGRELQEDNLTLSKSWTPPRGPIPYASHRALLGKERAELTSELKGEWEEKERAIRAEGKERIATLQAKVSALQGELNAARAEYQSGLRHITARGDDANKQANRAHSQLVSTLEAHNSTLTQQVSEAHRARDEALSNLERVRKELQSLEQSSMNDLVQLRAELEKERMTSIKLQEEIARQVTQWREMTSIIETEASMYQEAENKYAYEISELESLLQSTTQALEVEVQEKERRESERTTSVDGPSLEDIARFDIDSAGDRAGGDTLCTQCQSALGTTAARTHSASKPQQQPGERGMMDTLDVSAISFATTQADEGGNNSDKQRRMIAKIEAVMERASRAVGEKKQIEKRLTLTQRRLRQTVAEVKRLERLLLVHEDKYKRQGGRVLAKSALERLTEGTLTRGELDETKEELHILEVNQEAVQKEIGYVLVYLEEQALELMEQLGIADTTTAAMYHTPGGPSMNDDSLMITASPHLDLSVAQVVERREASVARHSKLMANLLATLKSQSHLMIKEQQTAQERDALVSELAQVKSELLESRRSQQDADLDTNEALALNQTLLGYKDEAAECRKLLGDVVTYLHEQLLVLVQAGHRAQQQDGNHESGDRDTLDLGSLDTTYPAVDELVALVTLLMSRHHEKFSVVLNDQINDSGELVSTWAKVEGLQEEKECLIKDLENVRASLQDTTSRADNLATLLDAERDAVRRLESTLPAAEQVQQLHTRIKELEEQVRNCNTLSTSLTTELGAAQESLRRVEAEKMVVSSELEQSRARIEMLRTQSEAAIAASHMKPDPSELHNVQQQLHEAESELAALKEQLKQSQSARDRSLNEATRTMSDSQTLIHQLRMENQTLALERRRADLNLGDMKQRVDELERQLRRTSQSPVHNALTLGHMQDRLRAAQAENDALSTRLDIQAQELASIKAREVRELDSASARVNAYQRRCRDLENELALTRPPGTLAALEKWRHSADLDLKPLSETSSIQETYSQYRDQNDGELRSIVKGLERLQKTIRATPPRTSRPHPGSTRLSSLSPPRIRQPSSSPLSPRPVPSTSRALDELHNSILSIGQSFDDSRSHVMEV